MTRRLTQTAFRLAPELMAALAEVKARDGVPYSEQVRRALLLWFADRGVPIGQPEKKAGRKRAATRKRP